MKVTNRSAFHDYEIRGSLEAGIKLTGPEVKSIKDNRVSLSGSYVRVVGSEIYLINARVEPYQFAHVEDFDPRRTRKLLLSKKEIMTLKSKAEGGGLTLIPVSMYTKNGLIKVEIGLARGTKEYEKREKLKRRDQRRELERRFRTKIS